MKMKSKIKSLFGTELRHELAAICDTKRIEKNTDKMDLVVRLLRSNGVSFDLLGGATNRIVVMMDGYAVKIAVDRQGFKDNWMEFSLSVETQPYTTKSYETNGYILVQACVRLITLEEWRARKPEILKILDAFGREYLLGDVGYYDLNMTNWGVQDDNSLVILDYAYCHRLTEELFTCPVCGAILTYDTNCVNFLCSDRANCHEKYSYNDIKSIQGEDIDWDMIKERKKDAICVPEGKDFITVERDSDKLLDERTVVIRSYWELEKFKEEKTMTDLDMNNPEVLDLLAQAMLEKLSGNAELAEELLAQAKLPEEEIQKKAQLECVIDPEFAEKMDWDNTDRKRYHSKESYIEEEEEPAATTTLDDLIRRLFNAPEEEPGEEDCEEEEESNSFSIKDLDLPGDNDDYILPEPIGGYPVRSLDLSPMKPVNLNEDQGMKELLGLLSGETTVEEVAENEEKEESEEEPEEEDYEEEEEPIDTQPTEEEEPGDTWEEEDNMPEEDPRTFMEEPIRLDPQTGETTQQVLVYMTGSVPSSEVVLDQTSLMESYKELYEEEDEEVATVV